MERGRICWGTDMRKRNGTLIWRFDAAFEALDNVGGTFYILKKMDPSAMFFHV